MWAAGPLMSLGCNGCNFGLQTTPPPADASPQEIALAGAKVMIGAGDIADCGNIGDEGTARLVDSVMRVNAAANVETVPFTLGDHAYPLGSDRQFRLCYTPSWGDSSKMIMRYVRPTMGNHDWQVQRGRPYYKYFGDRAGPDGKGYYSYNVGNWHVIVLNSELAVEASVEDVREQEQWLRDDLLKNRAKCTLAYFHRPLFSSAFRSGDPHVRAIWEFLYANNVDLILNGHDHHYERFLPQTPAGVVDSVRGIEQILVGTGGASLRGFKSRFGFRDPRVAENSATRIQGRFGVLKLSLGADGYRSAFIEVGGRVWDESGRKCH